MNTLTVDQIRNTLSSIEADFSTAMNSKDFMTAADLQEKRIALWDKLVAMIQAEDPYASEADIRFYEDIRI